MIQIIAYFWCTHLHTASLSFIVLSIQSIIIDNSKVRKVFCFDRMQFFMIWLIPYFWCTHLHTGLISSIVLWILYYIVGKIKVRAVLFWLNDIYVCFDSFHIFDALTFIMHHSDSLFCLLNQKSSVTARQ